MNEDTRSFLYTLHLKSSHLERGTNSIINLTWKDRTTNHLYYFSLLKCGEKPRQHYISIKSIPVVPLGFCCVWLQMKTMLKKHLTSILSTYRQSFHLPFWYNLAWATTCQRDKIPMVLRQVQKRALWIILEIHDLGYKLWHIPWRNHAWILCYGCNVCLVNQLCEL